MRFNIGQSGFSRRILLLAGCAIAAAQPALANEAADEQPGAGEGDIVVTARFREETLTDVPIAITALSGADLAQRAQTNLQDISRSVPTLDFRAGSSNKDRSTFIRGIGTITTSPGVEPSVATVVDGVVLARPGQSTLDLLDVQRIEVLRGPQGTLFGKNASAGVINIVSRDPATDAFGGSALASWFEGNEWRLKVTVTGPIDDKLSFLLTGLVSEFDGNVRNIRTDEDVNGYKRQGVRGKLRFQPSEDVSFTLAGDWAYTFEDVPTGVFISTQRVAFPSGAVSQNPALAAVLAAEGITPGLNNTDVSPSFNATVRDNNGGLSFTADVGLGDYTLTSITAQRWWNNRQHQDWDSTGTLTAAIPRGEDLGRVASDQFSQELRLTSPQGKLIDYVVGLYYFQTTTRETYQRDVTLLAGNVATTYTGVASYRTNLKNYSAFGEANINFTDQFRAILGGRLIRDELEYSHARVSTTLTGVAGIRPSFASSGSTATTDYSARVGLQYDVSDRVNAYATFSRGYKGPAYNVFFNMQAFDLDPLDPETSKSFEIGLKGAAFDHLLTFAVAGYITKFSGFQANFQDTYLNTLVTRLINAGDVSSRGIDLDLTLRPAPGLVLTAAGAYNDAKIDDFKCPASAAVGTCADASGNALVNGKTLPFAPKWKFNIDGSYTFPVAERLELQLQSDFNWRSETQFSITQTPDTVQPSYGIWNASVALLSDGGWQLRGVVKNIANQHYSPAIGYGSVAGVSRFVPRDNDRYFGVIGSIDF